MKYSIKNTSNLNLEQIRPFLNSFLPFARQKMGFDKPVSINFVSDVNNSSQVLGKTAFYDPNDFSVTVYTDKRHPKDIMRSLSHELVHHSQNCRGAFDHKPAYGEGYFHQDDYMKEMEREAYEKGNMCFRSWEETYKKQLQESTYYITGETQMKLKHWKDQELFERLMEGYGYNKPMQEDEIEETHCNEGELGEAHCNESELDEGKDKSCPECKEAKGDCKCPPIEEEKHLKVQDGPGKGKKNMGITHDGKMVPNPMDESQLRSMIKEAISKALAKRK